MTTPIRAEFEVSLLKLQNALLKADMQTRKADEEQRKVSARVQRVIDKVKVAQAQVAGLEATGARAFAKLGKTLGKTAAVALAGTALTEIGIPEAAQPLVKIGTAAFSGATFGSAFGPGGALAGGAAFVTVAVFQELVQAVKGLGRRQEQIQSALLEARRQQAAVEREILRDREVEEERWKRTKEELEAESDQKIAQRIYRTALSVARDAR